MVMFTDTLREGNPAQWSGNFYQHSGNQMDALCPVYLLAKTLAGFKNLNTFWLKNLKMDP